MKLTELTPAAEVERWVARILRDDVLALSAYHVADSTGMVKLDAMENPYVLPEGIRDELGMLAASVELNRYPDAEARELKAALREFLGVPDDLDLLLGNGSDELIQLLALACARQGAAMLGLEPSFTMYPLIARICALNFVGVPLRSDFGIDADAVIAAMRDHDAALAFIASPNNPTGNLFDPREVERIVRNASGLVVIDEAYHPFAQATFMDRLREFPNLLIMRTLSKLGLAGLRLGILVGRPQWIEQINKLRLPYNVNVLTQAVAGRLLRNPGVLQSQAASIRAERTRLSTRMRNLPGVETFPSDANFIMFRVRAAQTVFKALLQHGILIKKLTGSHPALENCLRVTVGTAAENDSFVAALSAGLKS